MKKAKSRAQRRRAVRNVLLAVSMMMMLMIVTVGGTVAWLTSTSEVVENVFTTSDINITLTETTGEEYKMVPGTILDKDPTVTVKKGSEASWVFVEITETGGDVTVEGTTYSFDDFIDYAVASGWTQLDGETGVYYQEVADLTAETAEDVVLHVIAFNGTDDKIKVKDGVTKEMLNAIDDELNAEPSVDKRPKLNFVAYAIQKEGSDDAEAAWAKLNL